MSIEISSTALRDLAAASRVICRDELLAALSHSHTGVSAESEVIASELLPAYRVRLRRWQDEGVPPSDGIPEFVDAIRRSGNEAVVVAPWHEGAANFGLLLSADMTCLLAAIRFHSSYPERPTGPDWYLRV